MLLPGDFKGGASVSSFQLLAPWVAVYLCAQEWGTVSLQGYVASVLSFLDLRSVGLFEAKDPLDAIVET